MRKMNKSAFTLVELIVVITILAILATVAFISFGGQTGKAKNAKVTSDVRSIASKVNVLTLNSNSTVRDFLTGPSTNNTVRGTWAGIALSETSTGGTYAVGNINFFELKENEEKFKDPNGESYLYAYAAENGVAVFNVAGQTIDDAGWYTAIIEGSYYRATSADGPSLISASWASTVALYNGSGSQLY